MKKILAAIMLLTLFAGTAFAAPGRGYCYDGEHHGGRGRYGSSREYCYENHPELKEKYEQLGRLTSELEAEMNMEKPDKSKARALYKKLSALYRDMHEECCDERIDRMAEYCREHDFRGGEGHRGYGYGCGEGRRHGRHFRGGSAGMICIDTVSEENRAELDKLYRELRAEFRKDSPDSSKIKKLSEKIYDKKEKYREEAFEEILENPSKYRNAEFNCCGFYSIRIKDKD